MQETELLEVTPGEKDLIEAIRIHNRAFPHGHKSLLLEAQAAFDNLIKGNWLR